MHFSGISSEGGRHEKGRPIFVGCFFRLWVSFWLLAFALLRISASEHELSLSASAILVRFCLVLLILRYGARAVIIIFCFCAFAFPLLHFCVWDQFFAACLAPCVSAFWQMPGTRRSRKLVPRSTSMSCAPSKGEASSSQNASSNEQ